VTTDLTVVVTAHNETAVCGPTMDSGDRAVEVARERGYTVQTIIGLDAPSEATHAYFHQPCFDHWERRIHQERDLGRVRNALVPQTEGRYIAFLDADDLFSENWLAEGVAALDAAAERGVRAIAHPELNVVFDGLNTLMLSTDQTSPLFTPHYLYVRHFYDSLCMAPRDAHLAIPYQELDIPHGLAYEDFQWTIETMTAGWQHLVVKDTIIFKRRRDFSLVTESNRRKTIVRALPAMAIDRVRDLGTARREV
jgi:hypothetical protein